MELQQHGKERDQNLKRLLSKSIVFDKRSVHDIIFCFFEEDILLDPKKWMALAEQEKRGKFCLALFVLGQHLRDRGFLRANQTEKFLFRCVSLKGIRHISKLSFLPLPVKDAIEKAGITQKILRLFPNRFDRLMCLQRYLSSPYFVKENTIEHLKNGFREGDLGCVLLAILSGLLHCSESKTVLPGYRCKDATTISHYCKWLMHRNFATLVSSEKILVIAIGAFFIRLCGTTNLISLQLPFLKYGYLFSRKILAEIRQIPSLTQNFLLFIGALPNRMRLSSQVDYTLEDVYFRIFSSFDSGPLNTAYIPNLSRVFNFEIKLQDCSSSLVIANQPTFFLRQLRRCIQMALDCQKDFKPSQSIKHIIAELELQQSFEGVLIAGLVAVLARHAKARDVLSSTRLRPTALLEIMMHWPEFSTLATPFTSVSFAVLFHYARVCIEMRQQLVAARVCMQKWFIEKGFEEKNGLVNVMETKVCVYLDPVKQIIDFSALTCSNGFAFPTFLEQQRETLRLKRKNKTLKERSGIGKRCKCE